MSGTGGITLFDFASPTAIAEWQSINDAVMGGESSGTPVWSASGSMIFRGEVSLARGGGFASIRSAVGSYRLAERREITLLTRGDNKIYKLSLRTDPSFDGVSYQASFQAREQWEEVRIPFGKFLPTWHGQVLRDESPLDIGKIRSFGLLIADGQDGPFRLEVSAIRAR